MSGGPFGEALPLHQAQGAVRALQALWMQRC
jgi:hypothetical protein